MDLYEISSVVAIIISVLVAFDARRTKYKFSTSDYRAQQQVKSDTAILLSSLRSIMYKGVLSLLTKNPVDISPEKKAISNFLMSPTSFAYSAWVNEQSDRSDEADKESESWRLFFLYLAEISDMPDAHRAAMKAARIESLFDQLTRKDIKRIADFNSDLAESIGNRVENWKGDLLSSFFDPIRRESQEERKNFHAKLQYLKESGINDPNIDLFLVVTSKEEDVDAARKALEAGADVTMTDRDLLNRYKDQLKGFTD